MYCVNTRSRCRTHLHSLKLRIGGIAPRPRRETQPTSAELVRFHRFMPSSLDPRAANVGTLQGASIRSTHRWTSRGVPNRLTPGPGPRIGGAEPGAGSRAGVEGSGVCP